MGLIRDIDNFHIKLDVLFSQGAHKKIFPAVFQTNASGVAERYSATYLLISNTSKKAILEKKINRELAELNTGELFNVKFGQFHLRPLKNIYFEGAVHNSDYGLHGNLKLINSLIVIAVFVLLLAIINYVNLTTAKATIRTKEVAIKKIVGSSSHQLRYQFIMESILVSIISFLLAITLVQTSIPQFNRLVLIDIDLSTLNRPEIWTILISGVIFIGFLAGLYPSVYIATYKPVSHIKGMSIRSGGAIYRKLLLTFQFSVSIILISGIYVNYRQLDFARHLDPGFEKDKVVSVKIPIEFQWQFSGLETFRNNLIKQSSIENFSYSQNNPCEPFIHTVPAIIDGDTQRMKSYIIEPDYIDVMGLEIIEGRNFSWDRSSEMYKGYDYRPGHISGLLVNETAVKEFGMENPLGQLVYYPRDEKLFAFKIIGVIKDFHLRSIHDKIEPLNMAWGESPQFANIKCSSDNYSKVISIINNEYRNVFGDKPFVYQFLDKKYDQQYKSDERTAKIIGYFTVLSIIIACMGLFALSSFMVSRRTKEIGIRKSMGASVKTIYMMLSWEFIKWILLAVVVASPIAWFLMNRWLENFAYHINLGVDIFIIAALAAIVIALVTVTWQSLKTARANPVEALRYE